MDLSQLCVLQFEQMREQEDEWQRQFSAAGHTGVVLDSPTNGL
jgi:hypothetical protein